MPLSFTVIIMPRAQRRRQDDRDFLTLNAVLNSTLAVSRHNQDCLEELFSPEHQDLDDDRVNQRLSRFFHRTAMGLCTLSFELSEPSSRGPYNQWQKCREFFDTSLSWPDRDFRHEYR
jgi:hypothetical protein